MILRPPRRKKHGHSRAYSKHAWAAAAAAAAGGRGTLTCVWDASQVGIAVAALVLLGFGKAVVFALSPDRQKHGQAESFEPSRAPGTLGRAWTFNCPQLQITCCERWAIAAVLGFTAFAATGLEHSWQPEPAHRGHSSRAERQGGRVSSGAGLVWHSLTACRHQTATVRHQSPSRGGLR